MDTMLPASNDDEAESKEVTLREKRWATWLGKYPEEVTDICIVVFLLAVALMLALFLFIGFNLYTGISILGLALLIVSAIILMSQAAKQIAEAADQTDKESENVCYVLSRWRIKTLETAGVPADITGFLTELLKPDKESEPVGKLEMKEPLDSPDTWLAKTEKELGETRVAEFKEVILKYTRRDDEAKEFVEHI